MESKKKKKAENLGISDKIDNLFKQEVFINDKKPKE